MEINNALKNTLKTKASDYLKTPFSFTDCVSNPEDPSGYVVYGTIKKYGKKVHVQVEFKRKGLIPIYWRIMDNEVVLEATTLGKVRLGQNVCVSDPCYDRTVWCMTQLHNVKCGTWDAEVCKGCIDSFGERIYVLSLYHQSCVHNKNNLLWIDYGTLGVDSGQMSVVDDRYYRRGEDSVDSPDAAEAFYTTCCNITLSDFGAGLYCVNDQAVGVVTSSGCGDGVYSLQVAIENEEIVAIQINFM